MCVLMMSATPVLSPLPPQLESSATMTQTSTILPRRHTEGVLLRRNSAIRTSRVEFRSRPSGVCSATPSAEFYASDLLAARMPRVDAKTSLTRSTAVSGSRG